MAESFVFKAVKHGGEENIRLNSRLFKHVHSSKYQTIRIFQVLNVSQESKDWVADPANRVCDAPGSWYCVGQYPPALRPLIRHYRSCVAAAVPPRIAASELARSSWGGCAFLMYSVLI